MGDLGHGWKLENGTPQAGAELGGGWKVEAPVTPTPKPAAPQPQAYDGPAPPKGLELPGEFRPGEELPETFDGDPAEGADSVGYWDNPQQAKLAAEYNRALDAWKQKKSGPTPAAIPGMEKLGPLPGVPTPPNPILNPPSDAPEHVKMAYEAKYGTPPETLGTAFRDPVQQMTGGAGRILGAKSGRDVASGARQILGGATQVMMAPEVMAPAAAMAPVGTALSLGAGWTLQKGTEAGLKAAGVPEEYAGLAGDVAGLVGAGVAGSRVPQFRDAAIETLREVASKRAFRRSQQPSARGETPKVEVLPREEAPAQAEPQPVTLNAPQIEGPTEIGKGWTVEESPIQGGPLTRVRKIRTPKSFVPDTPPEAVAPPVAPAQQLETPTSGQEAQPVVAPPVEAPAILAPPVENPVSPSKSDSENAPPSKTSPGSTTDNTPVVSGEPGEVPVSNTPSLAVAPPSGGLPETQEVAAPEQRQQPEASSLAAELDKVRAENERLKAAKVAKSEPPAPANPSASLRKTAEAMAPQIEAKRNPAISNQRVTARRANIAEGMGRDADRMESVQSKLNALADAHDAGEIDPTLSGVRSRAAVEDLLSNSENFPHPYIHSAYIRDFMLRLKGKPGTKAGMDLLTRRNNGDGVRLRDADEIKTVSDLVDKAERAGITTAKYAKAELQRAKRLYSAGITPDNWTRARSAMQSLGMKKPAAPPAERQVKELERGLIGRKIPGYFPTPKPVVGQMLDAADIQPGMKVLEPSAGKGNIADAVREQAPGADLSTIEWQSELRKILELKGHKVAGDDFLKHAGQYDRIVMNPPFENGQDIEHVRHAYEQLKPGGRVVSIMGEGAFGRGDKKATEFRDWLDNVGGQSEKLEPGSFYSSERPTGVSTRMVTIEKPEAPLQNKPIEGPAFRPGMSRSAKVTESQVIPARAGREKYPVLHVNAQAMNILHEAAGMEDGHEIPGVTFTTPQAEELMRTITTEVRKARLRNKPEEVAKWEEIRSAIEQNRAQAKGRPLIAVQNGPDVTPEEHATALQEELDHASQLEATGDIYAHHLGPEGTKSFLGSPEGSKAAAALRRTYPDVSDSQAVMEIGVRLMRPGRFAELGLSPDEAQNLRDSYLSTLIERHGVERTVRISQKISAAKDRERVQYGHEGKATLTARRSGSGERVETTPAREDGAGSAVRKGGGGSGEGLPPVRDGEAPLQSRRDEGPEFRKKPSALRVATDFFKPVETRIGQEGPAGKQLKKHLIRAEDVGEVQAGKRVVALRDSGLQDLSREDRQNLVDSLQGYAQPKNAAVQKAFDGIRKVTDEIAQEATAAGVQSKQARTIRPEDPIPPTAKLTQAQKDLRAAGKRIFVQYRRPFQARSNFYPHVIPQPDDLRSGDIRRDVADNMVRNGVAANSDEARQMIDEYRKFIDTGERSKKLEAHLVESGQARDETEAHTLLGILRRRVIKRQGSLEYSRQVDLPFYDPDPARVMPKFVTATSLRLAQIREFGQNDEVVNRLIRIIDQTSGNPGFAKMAVDKILGKINEADTGTARISRAVRVFNGFKLGLSFIPNATQGALNSLLKSDLPSTLAGAKGLMTKEGRRFAMQSGASLEGVVNEMLRSVGADNSALGTFLKGTGFAQTEQANRIWAANAGYAYAKRMLARLQKNPNDGRALKILTELGLKPDVLLRLGKIDGDAALIAAKKFSDITQFRGGIKDLPYFAASPLGKVVFQFKSFVYGQTRLVYNETVGELKAGRFGRGLRTLLLLATVFPLAGEVIADLRTWIKGGERKTEGIKRWLEDIGQAGSLGVIYDMLDAGGWGKGAEFFGGPTIGEMGQAVNIAGGQNKTTNAAKWAVKHVPFLGPLVYSRIFPPKEPAQSPAMKRLTGGSKLTYPKLKRKP